MAPEALLDQVATIARYFLDSLPVRRVGASASRSALEEALGGLLPDEPSEPGEVIASLVRAVDPGLVASAGPRYFGFVIGGSLPAAVAADWLTSAWDQNAQTFATSPAAAVVEAIVADWILELLDLPRSASVGLVTGAQMATFTALAAGRHHVLRRVGWDVEADGLQGGPPVQVVVGAQAHGTIFTALRMLGLGNRSVKTVAADAQGRMRVDQLARVLATLTGPILVCAQVGNVNTGAFDQISEIAPLVQQREGWLHIDGAFGLWAATSERLRPLMAGLPLADSWCTDGHKWLNVPYDCGIAIVAHPAAHRAAMSVECAYAGPNVSEERDGMSWGPENSRRARGFALYAALRSLGRRGVQRLVERCCSHAQRMAQRLMMGTGFEVVNDVVLNQVLVCFRAPDGIDPDAFTDMVIARVQQDGTCWLGGTTWQGRRAMRISICNWSTTEEDIDLAASAILRAALLEHDGPDVVDRAPP